MTKAEQETIIRWDADEEIVSIFTAHPPIRRKLERAGLKPHKTSTMRGEPCGWFYKIPLGMLRWRVAGKRPPTDAERQARTSNLARVSRRRPANGEGPTQESTP